jgi:serine/threonine protein kinase
MDAERWQRVDDLLQSALQTPADQQDEFLRQACGDDTNLLEEVRSLLTSHRKAGSFLESPAFHDGTSVAATGETRQPRPNIANQTVSHYRMIGPLGSGGMGVVYHAEDTSPGAIGRAEVPSRTHGAGTSGIGALSARSARSVGAESSQHLHDLRNRRAQRASVRVFGLRSVTTGAFDPRVAIKFLNIAVNGPLSLERFKREEAIPGRLAHPHIAELIDAGVTPAGEPCLVLEH